MSADVALFCSCCCGCTEKRDIKVRGKLARGNLQKDGETEGGKRCKEEVVNRKRTGKGKRVGNNECRRKEWVSRMKMRRSRKIGGKERRRARWWWRIVVEAEGDQTGKIRAFRTLNWENKDENKD